MIPTFALLIHGIVGWALCGAIVAAGRRVTTMRRTLVVHAVGAPIIFAALTALYRSLFDFATPLEIAFAFLAIVILLDVVVVALLIEKSFDMFRSIIGTWLPFMGIFLATLIVSLALP